MVEKQGISDINKEKVGLATTLLQLNKILNDDDADILWNAFEDCLSLKQYNLCEKLLEKFSPRYPDNVIMKRVLVARLQLVRKNVSSALRVLEEAIRTKIPNNPRGLRLKGYAYLMMGNIYSEKRHRTKAIEAYNKGLSLLNIAIRLSKRKDLPSWSIRGEILYRLGKELVLLHNKRRAFQVLFDALKSYSEAIRLTRGRDIDALIRKAEVLQELAKIMSYSQDYEGAIEFLFDAVKIYDRLLARMEYRREELWLARALALRELAKMFFVVGDYKSAFYALSDSLLSLRNRVNADSDMSLETLKILMSIAADLADLSFEVGATKTQIKFEVLVVYLATVILKREPQNSDVILTKADFLVKLILSLPNKNSETFAHLVCEAISSLERIKNVLIDNEIKRRIAFLSNLIRKRGIKCHKSKN